MSMVVFFNISIYTHTLFGQLIYHPASRQKWFYQPTPACTSDLLLTIAKLHYKDNIKPYSLK